MMYGSIEPLGQRCTGKLGGYVGRVIKAEVHSASETASVVRVSEAASDVRVSEAASGVRLNAATSGRVRLGSQ